MITIMIPRAISMEEILDFSDRGSAEDDMYDFDFNVKYQACSLGK